MPENVAKRWSLWIGTAAVVGALFVGAALHGRANRAAEYSCAFGPISVVPLGGKRGHHIDVLLKNEDSRPLLFDVELKVNEGQPPAIWYKHSPTHGVLPGEQKTACFHFTETSPEKPLKRTAEAWVRVRVRNPENDYKIIGERTRCLDARLP